MINFMNKKFLVMVSALMGFAYVRAADKSAYSFAQPTPAAEMRELTSDRPDATESPYTVDAGHVQIEMSFAAFERDRHNPEKIPLHAESWNVAPVNFRFGLTQSFELQCVLDGYIRSKSELVGSSPRETQSGWGDVTLRGKYNFWGNDAGSHALAVMPFVKLPTNTHDLGNDHVEGGVIVPFAISFGEWGAGVMTEFDVVRAEADDGYDLVWVNTATLSRGLTERLGGFVELASETGQGRHALSFNSGLTYAVNANLQLDVGVNLGVTRAAADLGVFIGLAQRF